MTNIQKRLAVFCVISFAVGVSVASLWVMWSTKAVQPQEDTTEWTDGVIKAELDNGTLIFTGDGAIDATVVWLGLDAVTRHQVKRIIIAEGIKSIGECEFACGDYPNLEEVIIDADLNAIGHLAFWGNPNLKTVKFNGDCNNIDETAFENCPLLNL